jgi:hypothetical protein
MAKSDTTTYPLHEPFCVQPVYVDGVATITYVGPNAHVIFSVQQPDAYAGTMSRLVAVRMVVPREKLVEIGSALSSCQERRLDHTDSDDAFTLRVVN